MSDTEPITPAEPTTPAPAEPDTGDATDWKAEAEKFKSLHRKQEERAKANASAARELEQLKQQSMTELEKAVAQAKADTRTEVLREVGASRVDDTLRVAAAGRPVDVDALLDGLDRTRFIDTDGQPDRAAVEAWMDRIAPQPTDDPGTPKVFDLGQGARGNSAAGDKNALARNVFGL